MNPTGREDLYELGKTHGVLALVLKDHSEETGALLCFSALRAEVGFRWRTHSCSVAATVPVAHSYLGSYG